MVVFHVSTFTLHLHLAGESSSDKLLRYRINYRVLFVRRKEETENSLKYSTESEH